MLLNLSEEKKILGVLSENSLTNNEIAEKTRLNINKVRKNTLKLKKEGKILVVSKKGRENVYAIKEESEGVIISVGSSNLPFDLSENPKFIDSLMFSFITFAGNPNYNQIQNFFSSLGIINKSVLFAIFRNIEKKLIKMSNVPEGPYAKILHYIIKNTQRIKQEYPLTMHFQEAYKLFKPLGILDIQQFVNYIKKLSEEYPEFISISSSKIGVPADLFTFKKVFIEQIAFITSGAWSVN